MCESLGYILNKCCKSPWLMEHYRLLAIPLVLECDRKIRIQICCLFNPLLDGVRLELYCLKYCIIRIECYRRTCSLFLEFCLWKHTVNKFSCRYSLLVCIVIKVAIPGNIYYKLVRQCIYNCRTYSVKSAAYLVGGAVKLATCMQHCVYNTLRRNSLLLMYIDRNASSIVRHGCRAILVDAHPYIVAIPRQMLIHRVVYKLLYEVVQSASPCVADVHSRSQSYRLKSL